MTPTEKRYRLVRPHGAAVARPRPRHVATGRGRPPRRPVAGARRARHRQDHDAGRGDRRPDRGAGRGARLGAGAHLQPQGRRGAARPGHRPARPDDVHADLLDVPLLRLRAGPAVLARRPLRRAAAPAQRAGAGRRPARAAGRRARGGRSWPDALQRGLAAPAASPRRSPRCSRGRARRGSTPARCAGSARENDLPGVRRGRAVPRAVPQNARRPGRHRLRRAGPPCGDRGRASTSAELRAGSRHVFVDEYQDTDPGQVRLLQAIAGDGPTWSVVGDPHQSIYAFRGADVRGILDFPDRFRRARRPPGRRAGAADVPPLRAARSSPPPRVAARLPLTGLHRRGGARRFAHRRRRGADGDGPGRRAHPDTERAEVERLADLLRRAHLEHGVPWSRDGRPGALRSHLHPGAAPRAGRGRGPGGGRRRRDAARP